MDHEPARTPGDRCPDGGVLEIQTRGIRGGRVGAHGRGQRLGVPPRLIPFRLRKDVLLVEHLRPLGIVARGFRLGTIARERGHGLVPCFLERTRVELEQELSHPNVVPLVEGNAGDDPAHLGSDRRGLKRLDASRRVEREGHVPLHGGGQADGDPRAPWRPLLAAAGRNKQEKDASEKQPAPRIR